MNILKTENIIEKDIYQKMCYHFKLDNIFRKLFSGIKKYRYFDISFPDKEHIYFTSNNNFYLLNSISFLSKFIKEDSRLLLSMKESRIFNIKEKKKILLYLHIDWFLIFKKITNDELVNNEQIIEYLKFETNDENIENKIKKIVGKSEERSNIYTINKNSVIVNLLNEKLSKNKRKISLSNYDLIMQNPLISFIEICSGFHNKKLNSFLIKMNEISQKILLKQTITEEMKFCLKIRKIKRTNKRGLYIINQNTIIIDPRYVDSFIHELGHWYHTWFEKDIKKEEDAENFAENFYKILDLEDSIL